MIDPEYSAAVRRQLTEWLNGRPVHSDPPADECCPDFSCCYPDLLMPREERERYVMRRLGEMPSELAQ